MLRRAWRLGPASRLAIFAAAVSGIALHAIEASANDFIMPNPGEGSPDAKAEAAKIAQKLQLQPGMTFADVGANNGFWTKMVLSHVLPGGKAYATDAGVNEAALAAAQDYLPKGMVTVRDLLANNSGLPSDGSIDGIMLRMSFHYEHHPATAAAAFYKALKPGGLLWIAEHPGCSDPWGESITPEDVANRVEVKDDAFPGNPLQSMPHVLQFTPTNHVFLAAGFGLKEKGDWTGPGWMQCSWYAVYQKPPMSA